MVYATVGGSHAETGPNSIEKWFYSLNRHSKKTLDDLSPYDLLMLLSCYCKSIPAENFKKKEAKQGTKVISTSLL